MGEIENPPWAGYKEEDGHQTDGFMMFCTTLAECKPPLIHPEGDHLPPHRHAMVDSMSPMT